MAFRNYKNVHPLCVVRTSAEELEKRIDEIQEKFDIIDLQYSTHCDSNGVEKFSVLLLIKPTWRLWK